MTETELNALLAGITPANEAARAAAHAHWASLAKPLGGLGRLETMLEDAAALTGSAELDLSRRVVVVLCADNGVVAQGVSQTGQEVTRAVAENLAMRRTSVCQMARTAHCDVLPVDMGMAGEPVPGMRSCRIAAGTADFTQGPAMSRAEAVQAVGEGIALARELAEDGYRLIATGEMGIGNTTTSSAVAAVLLGQPVELMTGRGAGLSDEGLARKVDAICRGILCNEPDPEDTLDVLAKLGGFDIAGLCGVFLGGALAGVPVLADGFISGVAALCAVRLCPAAAKAVFASHCSAEPAARIVLEALGKAPIITAGLHLGEGTGAVASIPLWDMALAVYAPMLTLVLGGAASGKSEYAESLVLKTTGPRYYLATMQVWDAECAARVEKHRKMRAAKQFETVECPLHLGNVSLPARGTALLEDLGNLAANELYDPAGAGENAAKAILHGLESLAAQCENLIVVSNEVFSGGADYAGDTGRYLLALAQVNNAFAARADAVVRVVCGIPVYYKGVEK